MEPWQGHLPSIVGPVCSFVPRQVPVPPVAPSGATSLKGPLASLSSQDSSSSIAESKRWKIWACSDDPLASLKAARRIQSARGPKDSKPQYASFSQKMESPVDGLRIQGAPLQLCIRALEELRIHVSEDDSKHQVLEIVLAFYKKCNHLMCLDDVPYCKVSITAIHRELAHPPPDWSALKSIVRLYWKGSDITRHFDREILSIQSLDAVCSRLVSAT